MALSIDNLVSWHIVTSAEYNAGTPVEKDLYFLSDTGEFMRGTTNYSGTIVMYTGELPTESIAKNRLYVNSETLAGSIYNGTEWITVVKPVVDTVVADDTNPVSSKAVIAYVAEQMKQAADSATTVADIEWDSTDISLNVTKGDGSSQSITLEGLAVGLNYDRTNGKLDLTDIAGTVLGTVNIDLERFVKSGEYDAVEKNIILYFDEEKNDSVTIPVGDLVDTYSAEGDNSMSLTVENNVVKGSVKVSAADGNALTVVEDGLFVAIPEAEEVDVTGKMDKVVGATEGNIVTLDAEGNAVDSGKNFDDIVPNNHVYEGTTLEEAVADATPVKGDIAIVSTPIGETGKVQKTVHQFDGENWVAFDSDYDASKIILPEDWLTTAKIGVIQTLTNGQATIAKAGTDVLTALQNMTLKETQPTVTQPAVSFTDSSDSEFKAYEVGDTVTVAVTATLSAGTYQYGRFNADEQFETSTSAGVTATAWTFTDSEGVEKTDGGNTADFGTVEVVDDMAYNVTAKATFEASAYTPSTNLKNPATVASIAAGSKTKTTANITGFRKAFYGYTTEAIENENINSDFIRGLQFSSTGAVAAGTVLEDKYVAGTRAVIIAYPATIRDAASIIDVGGMNTEIVKAPDFTVDVEGLNKSKAVPYKVYVYRFADPGASADNTYKVTI